MKKYCNKDSVLRLKMSLPTLVISAVFTWGMVFLVCGWIVGLCTSSTLEVVVCVRGLKRVEGKFMLAPLT